MPEPVSEALKRAIPLANVGIVVQEQGRPRLSSAGIGDEPHDEIAGQAHLKTGTLDSVKSMAGYVEARNGKSGSCVIINHPNAALGQAVQDALVEWVQRR